MRTLTVDNPTIGRFTWELPKELEHQLRRFDRKVSPVAAAHPEAADAILNDYLNKVQTLIMENLGLIVFTTIFLSGRGEKSAEIKKTFESMHRANRKRTENLVKKLQ